MTDVVIILHGEDGKPDVVRMGNIEGTVVVNFIEGTVKADTKQEVVNFIEGTVKADTKQDVTLIDAATGEQIVRE